MRIMGVVVTNVHLEIIYLDSMLYSDVTTGENIFVIHAESVELNESPSVCKFNFFMYSPDRK